MSKLKEIIRKIDYDDSGAPWLLTEDEAVQQVKDIFLELIGEDNPHTPDAKMHFDAHDYQYPCCERVQSHNSTLAELRKKVEEL